MALLGGFVLWNGLSVVWSVEPDRSWEYFNRGAVYFAFAALGLVVGVLPRAPRVVALGLLGIFGAALLWALAGKVVPNLYPDGERIARLRAPLEYWNALALLAAMTMLLGALGRDPAGAQAGSSRSAGSSLCSWRPSRCSSLTRAGGAVVALLTVGVFLVVSRERADAIAALVVGIVPAVALGAWAFTQPGIVGDGQPYDRRLDDGLQFGARAPGGRLSRRRGRVATG